MTPSMFVKSWPINSPDPAVEDTITHVRMAASVGDFMSGGGRMQGLVENYVQPTSGQTYRELLSRCKAEGKKVIAVATYHWRNGRLGEGDIATATGFGEYRMNHPLLEPFGYEGGVKETGQALFREASKPDSPIVAIQVFNEEPTSPEVYADRVKWFAEERDRRGLQGKVKIIAGYGLTEHGWRLMEAGAPYADVLDVHLLKANRVFGDLKRAFQIAVQHGCEVWPLEMANLGLSRNDYEAVFLDTNCISCFPDGVNPWNSPWNPVHNYALEHDPEAKAAWLSVTGGVEPEPPEKTWLERAQQTYDNHLKDDPNLTKAHKRWMRQMMKAGEEKR